MYHSLQGNVGLGKAIEYFTSHQITVSLPLNDIQKYDLIADFNDGLQRVQVKTSRYKAKSGYYSVNLKNSGGSSGKSVIRPFDNKLCDYVFVYSADNRCYLIPSNTILAKTAITLNKECDKYEVHTKLFSEFAEDVEQ